MSCRVLISPVSYRDRSLFREAIEEFTKYTCITWAVRKSELDYAEITDGGPNSGCLSNVGKLGGRQTINLQNVRCHQVGVMIETTAAVLLVSRQ